MNENNNAIADHAQMLFALLCQIESRIVDDECGDPQFANPADCQELVAEIRALISKLDRK
jgi:hypothetical protein